MPLPSSLSDSSFFSYSIIPALDLEHHLSISYLVVSISQRPTPSLSRYSVLQAHSPLSPFILSFLLFALLFRCFAPLLSKESEGNQQKGCKLRVFDLQPNQLIPLRSYYRAVHLTQF